jgi:hypothetical protein
VTDYMVERAAWVMARLNRAEAPDNEDRDTARAALTAALSPPIVPATLPGQADE